MKDRRFVVAKTMDVDQKSIFKYSSLVSVLDVEAEVGLSFMVSIREEEIQEINALDCGRMTMDELTSRHSEQLLKASAYGYKIISIQKDNATLDEAAGAVVAEWSDTFQPPAPKVVAFRKIRGHIRGCLVR